MRFFYGELPESMVLQDNLGERRLLPIQLCESEEALLLRMLVPGIGKEDLRVELAGQSLCVSGYIRPEKGLYHRQERAAGYFRRQVDLGVAVRAGQADAELRDGVLTLKMPKLNRSRARRIGLESCK